jgi:hypothetical protein
MLRKCWLHVAQSGQQSLPEGPGMTPERDIQDLQNDRVSIGLCHPPAPCRRFTEGSTWGNTPTVAAVQPNAGSGLHVPVQLALSAPLTKVVEPTETAASTRVRAVHPLRTTRTIRCDHGLSLAVRSSGTSRTASRCEYTGHYCMAQTDVGEERHSESRISRDATGNRFACPLSYDSRSGRILI